MGDEEYVLSGAAATTASREKASEAIPAATLDPGIAVFVGNDRDQSNKTKLNKGGSGAYRACADYL